MTCSSRQADTKGHLYFPVEEFKAQRSCSMVDCAEGHPTDDTKCHQCANAYLYDDVDHRMGDNIGFFESHPDFIEFLIDEFGSPLALFDDPTRFYAPIHTYIHPITL